MLILNSSLVTPEKSHHTFLKNEITCGNIITCGNDLSLVASPRVIGHLATRDDIFATRDFIFEERVVGFSRVHL